MLLMLWLISPHQEERKQRGGGFQAEHMGIDCTPPVEPPGLQPCNCGLNMLGKKHGITGEESL